MSASDGYVFDASGNTTGDPQGRTFIYDAGNKQAEVKNSSNTTRRRVFTPMSLDIYWVAFIRINRGA
ncbi:MAG: hypothetical protein LC113_10715 [Acidobacteria bacterium]|nr:hypothetical protein [Acidobacteriota bacterium]